MEGAIADVPLLGEIRFPSSLGQPRSLCSAATNAASQSRSPDASANRSAAISSSRAHSRHVDKVLDRDRSNAESALALSRHQIERCELGQRFTQRSGTDLVGLLQPPDMHAIARLERPAQDVGVKPAECRLGMRGRTAASSVWSRAT